MPRARVRGQQTRPVRCTAVFDVLSCYVWFRHVLVRFVMFVSTASPCSLWPALTCEALPDVLPHGTWNCSKGLEQGSVCELVCPAGLSPVGATRQVCNSPSWTGGFVKCTGSLSVKQLCLTAVATNALGPAQVLSWLEVGSFRVDSRVLWVLLWVLLCSFPRGECGDRRRDVDGCSPQFRIPPSSKWCVRCFRGWEVCVHPLPT